MNLSSASGILTESLRKALAPWIGGRPAIESLSGGLTNQNFRITAENGELFVLRLAGAETGALGIRRADEAVCLRHAFALGIGVEPLFADAEQGVFLMRYVEAAPLELSQAQDDPVMLEKLARLLRTLHDGPVIPGRFVVEEVIASYQVEAGLRGLPFPEAFSETIVLRERLSDLLASGFRAVPCHNDLLAGNLLYDGDRLWLLDWEYAGMGDARFDLANLISNLELTGSVRQALLECYFGSVDEAESRGPEIEAMLILSDLREAAWGFLQTALHQEEVGGFDYQSYGRKFLTRAFSRPVPGWD